MRMRHAERTSTAQPSTVVGHKYGEGAVLGAFQKALGLSRLEPSDNFFQSGMQNVFPS